MKPCVLITGVAGGIGTATVEAFSSAGWYTIGVDRVRSEKTTLPDRFIEADLSNIEAIQFLCEDIQQHEGRLQALVNNAAVQIEKSLVETEPQEWDTVMSVNVRAAFLTLKWTYPMLKKKGGGRSERIFSPCGCNL
jgi:NAD(P)-dependent dehydrogenase (short-subunit alcohol dehydrogenase family)